MRLFNKLDKSGGIRLGLLRFFLIGSRPSRGSKLSGGIELKSRFVGFHDKMDFVDFLLICINT